MLTEDEINQMSLRISTTIEYSLFFPFYVFAISINSLAANYEVVSDI